MVMAVRNEERFVTAAIRSVLRQTLRDLELIVVDDASTDRTPALLAETSDERVHVLRNEQPEGLASSLNSGLDAASGRFVARLDGDDVALPSRLEEQVAALGNRPDISLLGTGYVDLDEDGTVGAVHRMPRGETAVRWHGLFAAPVVHPTVLIDRRVLERERLRFDTSYLESEDYDLFARLLRCGAGANLAAPLTAKRAHPRQASRRRGELQLEFQREVALREIAAVAPGLPSAELAWAIGARQPLGDLVEPAAEAFLALLGAFERAYGRDPGVRDAAARALARCGRVLAALRLAPTLPLTVARTRRGGDARAARTAMRRWLVRLEPDTIRVTVVSPEPTPYRAPLFDRIAQRLDLTVVYAARSVAGRTWSVAPTHDSVFLRGLGVPGARRLLRHEYPITPEIFRVLGATRPDVAVISGWSTFAAQIAFAWCRARSTPYILVVESHDLGPRSAWRRAVKGAVVPWIVRGAESVLVVGTLARESVVARGADPERVRVFANTIDVGVWADRVDALRPPRVDGEVVVLGVGRLAAEKGFDALIRAVAVAGDPRLRVGIVGEGVERESLAALAAELAVPLELRGDLSSDELLAAYASADVFALLSTHEPWGVVVNEAAASALPLVLSDRVGAARDLLRDGENGFLVPAGDPETAARALRVLLDPDERRRAGARSRELVREWAYDPSVEAFVDAVREATASR
jgi:glycosyltransferase involved in cell wall biosynthesis/GT2 family glycosyltransferase